MGSSQTRRVDVRVLAATNRDLQRCTGEGKFREDLYYRLNVFPIELPPLRERRGDIGILAAAFAEKFAKSMGRPIEPLSVDCIRRLEAYRWPGNVRELQNIIERAVITARDGKLNLDRALPESVGVSRRRVDRRRRHRSSVCAPLKSLKIWSGTILSPPWKRAVGKSPDKRRRHAAWHQADDPQLARESARYRAQTLIALTKNHIFRRRDLVGSEISLPVPTRHSHSKLLDFLTYSTLPRLWHGWRNSSVPTALSRINHGGEDHEKSL